MTKYCVEIVEQGTGKVEKRFEPTSERSAERIDDGVNINLNHEKYYTQIVEANPEVLK